MALLLQVFAVRLIVFPLDMELKAIGSGEYVVALVAYAMFLAWLVATTLLDLHRPLDHRSPVRIVLYALWLVSLTSYALMNRALLSTTQQTGADRRIVGGLPCYRTTPPDQDGSATPNPGQAGQGAAGPLACQRPTTPNCSITLICKEASVAIPGVPEAAVGLPTARP